MTEMKLHSVAPWNYFLCIENLSLVEILHYNAKQKKKTYTDLHESNGEMLLQFEKKKMEYRKNKNIIELIATIAS